ncbi:hypothetical protein APHAL10511_008586 [Amanita phalloides]|nr:hypothetical protein APHAL10511_008586 [Amanita phalloides]
MADFLFAEWQRQLDALDLRSEVARIVDGRMQTENARIRVQGESDEDGDPTGSNTIHTKYKQHHCTVYFNDTFAMKIRFRDIKYDGKKYDLVLRQPDSQFREKSLARYIRAVAAEFEVSFSHVMGVVAADLGLPYKENAETEPTCEALHPYQIYISAKCIRAVVLSNLQPLEDVKSSLNDPIRYSPTDAVPTAGDIHVIPRTSVRIRRDGRTWSLKLHRRDQGNEYFLYHGATDGHLDNIIKVTCTVTFKGRVYGVFYYLDHPNPHSLEVYCSDVAEKVKDVSGGDMNILRDVHNVVMKNNAGRGSRFLKVVLN